MFCKREPSSRVGRVQRAVVLKFSATSRLNRTPKHPHGFTLVELMVVIVIIGLLAGVVTFSVRGYLITSKQSIAKMEISKIVQALETYYTLNDRYPSNEENLTVLAQATEKFPDGILTKVPRDPWGSPYQYNHPGRNAPYEVISYGADHREGGDGGERDISSVELGDTKK